MTHEQYIEYETARLAKQAGFDWKCTQCYYNGEFDNDYYDSYNFNGSCLYQISAPTQSVLQRWLREEKGYHIYISHTYTAIDCQVKSVWEILYEKMSFLKPNSILILEDDLGRSLAFDTYEAALEAGLKECLSLIINGQ
ncbi:MAG: hypothetical protein IKN91_03235 [Paludibacteraceae bacterium]|nr:hypothetical protein [Paludibacteraceae bacterium]